MVKRILKLAYRQFVCLICEPTTYLYISLLLLYFYYSSDSMRLFQRENNIRVNAVGYAAGVFSKQGFPLVAGLGAVALFSDLPLFRGNIMYESVRCRREEWLASRIVYVGGLSILYTLMLVCICIGMSGGNYQESWGKVLNSLAQGYGFNGMTLNATMSFSYMSVYTPLQALLLVSGICSMAGFTVGMIMLCISIAVGRIPAIMMGGVLSLIDVMVENGLPYWAYRFSPFSFIRLSIMMSDGQGYFPSIRQAVFSMIVVIVITGGLSMLLIRRNGMFAKQLFAEQY